MIWVRKIENEKGGYADAKGKRFGVGWCVKMITPDGSTEADHGYERHASIQAACDAWGLTPYVDPADVEQLTNTTTEK